MNNRRSRQLSFMQPNSKPVKQKIGVFSRWSKRLEELGFGKVVKSQLLSEISIINTFTDVFKVIAG